jgi:tRNA nucleotidyltransferase (CCA-adding enzyme)
MLTMKSSINSILKEVLEMVKPSGKELTKINKTVKLFLKKIEQNRKDRKINAQVFIGGSFAKKTLIKKDSYDIDIFIRFDKKYKNELLSDLTEKILSGLRAVRVHGSRDYFKAHSSGNLFFEIVPVRKIKNPKEAENITDLSYSHVNYIKKKIKSEKLLDEIRLAKAFCYANGSYGAESYVQGFSGYGLELLVYKYKSFLNFIKAMNKIKLDKKEVIDIEKHHKNKSRILMDLNSAKLHSPIILVDPTYKHRNVLAALSLETLVSFQKNCKDFIRKPGREFFVKKVINMEKLRIDANSKGYEFIILKAETDKQEGDIAGSKLLKIYRHLSSESSGFFEIKAKGFEYSKGKTARFFLVGKKKKEILISGPRIDQEKHVKRFRMKHKIVSIKNSRLYAKIHLNFTLKQFLQNWIVKNQKKIKDMHITKIEIVG